MLAAIGPCPPEGLEQEYLLCVLAVAAVTHQQEELAAHLATAGRLLDALNYLPDRYPVISLLWAPLSGTPDPETWDRYREVIDVAHLPADPWYQALMSVGGGFQHWMVGAEFDTAEREFTAALDAFRELGDRWGTIVTLTQLAWLAAYRGESERAIVMVDEALALAEELGATESTAELLSERGRCGLIAGEPEAARADYRRALDVARRTGVRELLAGVHLGLAECARALGDLAQARADCELALSEVLRGWYTGESTRVLTLISLARIAEADGDQRLARGYYRQAAGSSHGDRDPTLGGRLAEALAALALLDADPERAAGLLGLAAALSGRAVPPGPDAVRTAEAARSALGVPAYEAAHGRYAGLAVTEARQVLRTFTRTGAEPGDGPP
jgi:tetratricopeptide (TPR) repeat protein